MDRSRLLAAGLVLAGVASGCRHGEVSYSVIPSGTVASAPAKPPDCPIIFLRTKPDRPYEEMPVIKVYVAADVLTMPSAETVQRALAAKACELGADAILVTGELDYSRTGGWMTGVALKFANSPPAVESK